MSEAVANRLSSDMTVHEMRRSRLDKLEELNVKLAVIYSHASYGYPSTHLSNSGVLEEERRTIIDELATINLMRYKT